MQEVTYARGKVGRRSSRKLGRPSNLLEHPKVQDLRVRAPRVSCGAYEEVGSPRAAGGYVRQPVTSLNNQGLPESGSVA